MPDAPWVLASDGSRLPFGYHCARCGTTQRVATPCSVGVWSAIGRAFTAEHAHCLDPTSPPMETPSDATCEASEAPAR